MKKLLLSALALSLLTATNIWSSDLDDEYDYAGISSLYGYDNDEESEEARSAQGSESLEGESTRNPFEDDEEEDIAEEIND